jgi:hypothetical protein
MNRKSLKGGRGWTPSGLVLRVRGSKRGGWPIITLWGSSHPLSRLRSADTIAPGPKLILGAGDATDGRKSLYS